MTYPNPVSVCWIDLGIILCGAVASILISSTAPTAEQRVAGFRLTARIYSIYVMCVLVYMVLLLAWSG